MFSFISAQVREVSQKTSSIMALKLQKILITDKTDPSCEEILRQGGLAVDVKLKLPKEELLQVIQVGMNPLRLS